VIIIVHFTKARSYQVSAVPSAYIHALECFIAAKQEFLSSNALSVSQTVSVADSRTLETVYDHQRKYVSALVKQLPPGTVFPAASRTVLIHPPTTFKLSVARQGPFLLQPAPRTLEGSEDGDATDLVYLAAKTGLEDADAEDSGKGDRLGALLIAYADGKIDVCLDVERVEAQWDGKLVMIF
jgi:nucleoporin NUP82